MLVYLVMQMTTSTAMLLSRLIAVMISAPVFIVPAGAISVIGGAVGQFYIKAQLSVKRERSNAKVSFQA
jgi:hypothetical protein